MTIQAVFACWLTDPLNRWLGRRGVIFLSCAIAAIASVWEAFTYSWPQLFAARLLLGLGIGPKVNGFPLCPAQCRPHCGHELQTDILNLS